MGSSLQRRHPRGRGQAPNDDFQEGPLDDATDAELIAYLAPPPPAVSRVQAMVALSNAGLLTAVQNWVAGQDATTQLIWANASAFSRELSLLNGAAAALGLSGAQVEQLFVAAAAVVTPQEVAMLLASAALGRLALGQEIDAAATTTILAAATGHFTLTGEAATCQIQAAAAQGGFTLMGEAAAFRTQEAAAFGSFALTGEAATFQTLFVAAQGTLAVTAEAAAFQQQLAAASVSFAETGFAATFEGFLPRRIRCVCPLGAGDVDVDTEFAGCAAFALTGEPSLWSYDLLGGGGTIVAGTFSRGRWRALQESSRPSGRPPAGPPAGKVPPARTGAGRRQRRAGTRPARARADAGSPCGRGLRRALADALAVAAGVRRSQELMRHTATLHALAAAAQERDEDEALALLLVA